MSGWAGPSGFIPTLYQGYPTVNEVQNTAPLTFDRMGQSEANAYRTSFVYSLRSFSSFRFESAETRKKDLNSHPEKIWQSTAFLKGAQTRFETTNHNNNGAKNAHEYAARR